MTAGEVDGLCVKGKQKFIVKCRDDDTTGLQRRV